VDSGQIASGIVNGGLRDQDILVETWGNPVARYKGNQDVIYGYDVLNEPRE